MNKTEIHKSIKSANLSYQFSPRQGDCASIAKGLQDVFGGTLKAISSVPNEQYQDHVVVEIDGSIYDGLGKVRYAKIEEIFVQTHNWDCHEAHWFTVDDIKDNPLYSEEDSETVRSTVEDIVNAKNTS